MDQARRTQAWLAVGSQAVGRLFPPSPAARDERVQVALLAACAGMQGVTPTA